MPPQRPPRPPPPLVEAATHHSIEVSWAPYQKKLLKRLDEADGKLRVEVQISAQPHSGWDVAYKGFGERCVCGELEPQQECRIRFRFGNAHGWGDFSDPAVAATTVKPYDGQDIHRHLRRRDEEKLREVLETRQANIDAPDEDRGLSPLCVAAVEGFVDFCEILLEFGADIEWAAENGKTSLMLAAYKGKISVVEFLLSRGAKLSARDRAGMTPLHYAVDAEQSEIVRLFLDEGADPSARDSAGCTPLIRCALLKNNGNPAVAAALLNRGAEVDEADDAGQTPLFLCVLNRHEKMAATLLDRGADPHAVNARGVSVMRVAEGMHDRKLMLIMLKDHLLKRKQAQTAEEAA